MIDGHARVVRFFPEVRSAHFERDAAMTPGTTIFLKARSDYDPALAAVNQSFTKVSRWGAPFLAARLRPDVLEVPEPLWLDHCVLTFVMAHACRVRAALDGRDLRVCTYAIENAGLERVPRPLQGAARWAWPLLARWSARLAASPLHRVAFGTHGAREAFRDVVGHSWFARRDLDERVIEAMPALCACAAPALTQEGRVLFVGELHPRKGFDLLLAAWREASRDGSAHRRRLVVIGEGPLRTDVARAAASDPTITVMGPADRDVVHEELNRAQVVVLPSQPGGRWREQVGLPIVEGLAHGCTIVTTTETGLAGRLEALGHVVVPAPTTIEALRSALVRAVSSPVDPATVFASLPTSDGRTSADAWLAA